VAKAREVTTNPAGFVAENELSTASSSGPKRAAESRLSSQTTAQIGQIHPPSSSFEFTSAVAKRRRCVGPWDERNQALGSIINCQRQHLERSTASQGATTQLTRPAGAQIGQSNWSATARPPESPQQGPERQQQGQIGRRRKQGLTPAPARQIAA